MASASAASMSILAARGAILHPPIAAGPRRAAGAAGAAPPSPTTALWALRTGQRPSTPPPGSDSPNKRPGTYGLHRDAGRTRRPRRAGRSGGPGRREPAGPGSRRLAENELRFDAGGGEQFPEAAVQAPPPAKIFERPQGTARYDAKAAHPQNFELRIALKPSQKGRQRKGLPMTADHPQSAAFAQGRDHVPPQYVQRRQEDRNADDQAAGGPDQAHQRVQPGIDIVQMLEHLLAHDDIVTLRRDGGVAGGQIALIKAAIGLLPVDEPVRQFGGGHRHRREMRPHLEIAQQDAPPAADVEDRQCAACGRGGGGPRVDIGGQSLVARLPQAVEMRARGIDAEGLFLPAPKACRRREIRMLPAPTLQPRHPCRPRRSPAQLMRTGSILVKFSHDRTGNRPAQARGTRCRRQDRAEGYKRSRHGLSWVLMRLLCCFCRSWRWFPTDWRRSRRSPAFSPWDSRPAGGARAGALWRRRRRFSPFSWPGGRSRRHGRPSPRTA